MLWVGAALLRCRVRVAWGGGEGVGVFVGVDVASVAELDAILVEFSAGGDEEGDGVPEEEDQQEEYGKEEDRYAADEVGEGDAGCCGGLAVGGVPVVAVVIGLAGGGR